MFGIHGLDPFGLAHAAVGIVALVLGLAVIAQGKGSAAHRVWGTAYGVSMVLLNASALVIYDFTGRFNAFHAFALMSLATLAAGWVPALLRRPAPQCFERHAMFMAWSYVGLVAAFVSEVVTRVPAFRIRPWFDAVVAVLTLTVVALGALVIRRTVPAALSRLNSRKAQSATLL
jgi:uncharacterized membrane protein